MKITITIRFKKNDFDILVDNSQTIKKSLDIVGDALGLNFITKNINFLRSVEQKRMINVNNSYKKEMITTGDILEYV
ncbi:hypothetical protein NNC19_20330 [Clostridium sp. SHJSY1]|uniref:hypothetical protein n=1 Tax=Clostridium sp. SHJSY1 TaxID=2942483 RepID=UPI00287601C3|nr:hypothetical protein [Clostridium sp. SHJSY1]MDS0528045.1 hypothetical protein [Clostridium sp. SHJSY1]